MLENMWGNSGTVWQREGKMSMNCIARHTKQSDAMCCNITWLQIHTLGDGVCIHAERARDYRW